MFNILKENIGVCDSCEAMSKKNDGEQGGRKETNGATAAMLPVFIPTCSTAAQTN